MLLSVIENIWDFIYKTATNGLTLDLLFYIGIGFITIMVLFFIVKSYFAYEGRLERSLEKINRWLFTHQQIDETNLVEFNNLIKRAPRLLRYHWQQYILYREKDPSNYLSVYNCIDKPLHTSSYVANIKNFMSICVATTLTIFTLSLIGYGNSALTIASLSVPLITPVIIIILSVLFVMLLRAMQNFNLASLYQNFHLFNRYIDKASASIPKYVDFEILFTRKEIRGGIPVLNEYLEKRARQEAEELERARQNAVEHEEYDFVNSGIDGSLILERAMKESEIYLNARTRILTAIRQLEGEKDSLKRNYENTSKDYQRKLQASKENIERLRSQQEESTNRIEVNYIRKQQQDEIKKQEQLEKDQDDATNRFNQETVVLTEQIEKFRAELEEKRLYVQEAMLNEYKTFANKIFKEIQEDVGETHKAELSELADQKLEIARELEQIKEISMIKDEVITDLREIIRGTSLQNATNQQEVQIQTAEVADKKDSKKKQIKEIKEEPKEEPVQEQQAIVEEQVKEDFVVEKEPEIEQQPTQETEEQPEGYYDDNGYYWYPNGTYYDNLGYYHDEFGGIYDPQGNYTSYEQLQEIEKQKEAEAAALKTEAEQLQTQQSETPDNQIIEEFNINPFEQKPQIQPEEAKPEEIKEPMAKEKQEETKEPKVDEPQEEVTEPKAEEKQEKPAGKRGRPRKETTEEPAKKPAGKRGRPRKTEADSAPKPTGKRGRPKKETTTESKSPAPKTTGKRGRPKKETTEEPVKKPAGKRGRPRKTETEPIKKPIGKRGRPRKTTDNQEDLDLINKQIIEESNALLEQQNELTRQLGETLSKIKAVTEETESDNTDNETDN